MLIIIRTSSVALSWTELTLWLPTHAKCLFWTLHNIDWQLITKLITMITPVTQVSNRNLTVIVIAATSFLKDVNIIKGWLLVGAESKGIVGLDSWSPLTITVLHSGYSTGWIKKIICNLFPIPHSSVYNRASFLKSGVPGQKGQT